MSDFANNANIFLSLHSISLLVLGNCTNVINDTDLLQTNTTNNNTCMEEEPIPIPLDLTKIYVMSIIIIFTVIGNLLVITAIGKKYCLKK